VIKRSVAAALAGLLALVVALVVVRGRQSKGGPAAGFDPTECLSARARATLAIPDLGRVGERLAFLPGLRLAQLGATLSGLASAEGLADAFARELGFDPRQRESLSAAGIDPSRPLYAQDPLDGRPIALVPFLDGPKLEALAARHAENRLGAPRRTERRQGTVRVVVFAPEGQDAPALALALKDGYAVLSAGDGCERAVVAALERKREDSIAADPRFAAMVRDFAGSDAFAIFGNEAPGLSRAGFSYGAGAGLYVSAAEIRVLVHLPLADGQAKELALLSEPGGKDLVPSLDPDAFAVLRVGGDPSGIGPIVDLLLPSILAQALRQGGLELSRDVFGALEPGVAASVALAKSAQMTTLPSLDPRVTNPFSFLYLAAIGKVKGPERAKETMEKIAALAPRFGSKVNVREQNGVKLYDTHYHLGEGAGFALAGNRVVVAGGASRMDGLLSRLDKPEPPLRVRDAGARKAIDEWGFAVAVDLSRLVTSIRELPDSAYGVGGFAIKAAIGRWLDALDEITSIRLAGRTVAKSLQLEAAVSLRAPDTAEAAP
jgi:hypothetical protein